MTDVGEHFISTPPAEDAFPDPFAVLVIHKAKVEMNASLTEGENPTKNTLTPEDLPAKDSEKKAAEDILTSPKQLHKELQLKPVATPVLREVTNSQKDPIESTTPASVLAETSSPTSAEIKVFDKTKAQKKLEELSFEVMQEIREQLISKLGSNEQISESLTIKATEDGILISITDQFDFSMFRVGSAVPRGEVVIAMKVISDTLAKRQGMVRVYGHTDGRAYSGGKYDNWRLSTSRAHSARLMLARGGLGKKRISQVVGFADQKLKLIDQPEANINRRIEILLEVS